MCGSERLVVGPSHRACERFEAVRRFAARLIGCVFAPVVFVSLVFASFVLGPFVSVLCAATDSIRTAVKIATPNRLVARKIARALSAAFLFGSLEFP